MTYCQMVPFTAELVLPGQRDLQSTTGTKILASFPLTEEAGNFTEVASKS